MPFAGEGLATLPSYSRTAHFIWSECRLFFRAQFRGPAKRLAKSCCVPIMPGKKENRAVAECCWMRLLIREQFEALVSTCAPKLQSEIGASPVRHRSKLNRAPVYVSEIKHFFRYRRVRAPASRALIGDVLLVNRQLTSAMRQGSVGFALVYGDSAAANFRLRKIVGSCHPIKRGRQRWIRRDAWRGAAFLRLRARDRQQAHSCKNCLHSRCLHCRFLIFRGLQNARGRGTAFQVPAIYYGTHPRSISSFPAIRPPPHQLGI